MNTRYHMAWKHTNGLQNQSEKTKLENLLAEMNQLEDIFDLS